MAQRNRSRHLIVLFRGGCILFRFRHVDSPAALGRCCIWHGLVDCAKHCGATGRPAGHRRLRAETRLGARLADCSRCGPPSSYRRALPSWREYGPAFGLLTRPNFGMPPGNSGVYPGFATKIRQKFISLLLWNRYLMPSSDARRSVGSRWASVCRGWTAVPLPYKGFPARCGCPCSVHTVAACGEVHGLSMRSPALTRHGLDHVDALVQKSPEFSTLTFGRAGTVTTAFRVRKHLVVCCESRI